VCANPELAALDLKNMKLYKNAKSKDATTTNVIFKASIKSKYACGAEVDCIKKVYQQSILNYGCVLLPAKGWIVVLILLHNNRREKGGRNKGVLRI
jgi:uncharacterized protein